MLLHESSDACVEYLVRAGIAAPSADNSQPFRFYWDGRSLKVSFDYERCRGGIFGKRDHPTLLALGAVLENIDQAAVAANIDLCMTWLADDSPYYVSIEFAGNQEMIFPDQLALYERYTNRFPFKTIPVPKAVLHELSVLIDGAEGRLIEFQGGGPKHELVRLTRLAAEARFQNESLHKWLIGSLRCATPNGDASPDGLELATLNLPPGGGQFMRLISDWNRMRMFNRFGLYKILASIEVQLLKQAPLILALVGGRSGQDFVCAGRLMCRIWTYMNTQRLAVHPYYVLVDQLQRLDGNSLPEEHRVSIFNVKCSVDDLISLGEGEQLHMILRVGFPKKQPCRSGRLSVKDVLTFV
jgi:hypothetical protein